MSVKVEPSRELPKTVVPSVMKAARLLDAVAASREPLSLAALRRQLDLPKSSTLSLCTSLTTAGLLHRFDDGSYHLGAHVVGLAHAYLSRTDLPGEFSRAWLADPDLADESGVLALRDQREVLYVACRNGQHPHGLTFRVGMRLSATCTATGKALLSDLPDAALQALFKGERLQRMTRHSLSSIAALRTDLARVRAAGFAVDDEETQDGTYCVGVPVRHAGRVVAAVAVSRVKGGAYAERTPVIVAALQRLAADLAPRVEMLL